jgi:hypothetical protein
MLGVNNEEMYNKTVAYKEGLKAKMVKANNDLKKEEFTFRVS